jgi:hypothetical protein
MLAALSVGIIVVALNWFGADVGGCAPRSHGIPKQVRRHAQLRATPHYGAFAEVRKAGRHFCRCIASGPFVQI